MISALKILYTALACFFFIDLLLEYLVRGYGKHSLRFVQRFLKFAVSALFVLTFFAFYCAYGHLPIIHARENLFSLSLVTYFLLRFFLTGKERENLSVAGLTISFLLLLLADFNSYKPGPLSPFLESVWLYIHAISAAVAHSVYLVAFVITLSVLFRKTVSGRDYSEFETQLRSLARHVKLAFVFHTIMIGSGAIWAQRAWGRLWGWDPVEAWSLAAWLMYAAFLHQFSSKKGRTTMALGLSVMGFAMLLVSFWGIAYLSKTVHTYLKF